MIKSLVAIRLRSMLAATGGKGKNGEYRPMSTAKKIFFAVLYLYLIGMFAFMSFTVAVSLCVSTVPYGQDALFFAFYALIPFAVVFVLSVFETKSVLFESKDTELLLALPIRASDIVISRILSVILINYGIAAVFMLPFLVAYIGFGGGALGIVGGILSLLLVPLLATALSAGVGYLIARLSAKVKHKTFFTVAFYLLFFGIYFALYSKLMSVSGDAELTEIGDILASVAARAPLLVFIGEASMLRPLPFLSLLALTVGLGLLVFWRVSASFIGISTERQSAPHAVYTERRANASSPFFALVRKEFSRYTSSAGYIVNAPTGMIFTVLLTVALCFFDTSSIELMLAELGLPSATLIPIVTTGFVFCTLTNFMSACTVSLEGQNLWLVRMLPVKSSHILLAKAVPHVVITSTLTAVCSIVAAIVLRASFVYALCLLLLPLLANVASALWGVVINTALPKFDYTSEVQVVKQSMSTFLGMFVPMMLGMLLLVGVFVLSLLSLGWLAMLLCALLFVSVAVVMYVLLVRVSARAFDGFAC